MVIRANLFSPKLPPHPPKFQTHPLPSTILLCTKTKTHISCTTSSNSSDAELASDLASGLAKVNTHLEQREEAINKSKQLLYSELCQHMGLSSEEVKKKWRKMGEEEKWVLVRGFVSEWGVNFHPLSARSVKDMVDEHLAHENPSPPSSSSSLFPGLRRIMGL